MQRVSIEIYTKVEEAVRIVKEITDYKIELIVPFGSILLDNIMNLKILEDQARRMGKELVLRTEDPFGKNLLSLMTDEGKRDRTESVKIPDVSYGKDKFSKFTFPRISLPKINKKIIGIGLASILLICVAFIVSTTLFLHKATVTVYFSPQVLTKSVTVRVGDKEKTDVEKRTLNGLKVTTDISEEGGVSTTGTKIEGEYAKGKVTVYNSTTSAIELKKGTEFSYKHKDKTYKFELESAITVPARSDTVDTIVKGSIEASLKAKNIGEDYNVDKGEDFAIKDQASENVNAVSIDDFKGGLSRSVSVVAQADIDNLKKLLLEKITDSSKDALVQKVPLGFSMIEKSYTTSGTQYVIEGKVGDETNNLKGVATASIEGLTYSQKELSNLMNELSADIIPQGFDFKSLGSDMKVEVLGQTEKTVLSSSAADIQVTFKPSIVPRMEDKQIIDTIKGKELSEALKLIQEIEGVKEASISMTPGFIPINRLPSKDGSITVVFKVSE